MELSEDAFVLLEERVVEVVLSQDVVDFEEIRGARNSRIIVLSIGAVSFGLALTRRSVRFGRRLLVDCQLKIELLN